MLQTRIRIDGQDHFLPPGRDPDSIMAAITEQVRAGGGFVELSSTPERTVQALVSPGMNVTVIVTEVDEAMAEDDDIQRTWLDVFDL
jgi:5,10-methenyltetrahydromethanopterin hydrogenase